MYPAGEDAEDDRNAALRHDVCQLLEELRYTLYNIAKSRGNTKPRPRRLETFYVNIRHRFGKKPSSSRVADNAAMMRGVAAAMTKSNKGK
jgi:hypothetical protein